MAEQEIDGYQNMKFKPSDVLNWHIQGDWFDVCNCDVGCPCEFGSDPTPGYCEATMGWIIREGYYGETRLDGLSVVTVVRVNGNVLDRNRDLGFILDDRAEGGQRPALEMIFSGNAGGRFAMWGDLTVNPLGLEFAKVTVLHTPDAWSVEVPGRVRGSGRPFRKYMVPDKGTCMIINPPRPEAGPGVVTVGEGIDLEMDAMGLKFSWPNKSSKHIPFDFWGPGEHSWKKMVPEGDFEWSDRTPGD